MQTARRRSRFKKDTRMRITPVPCGAQLQSHVAEQTRVKFELPYGFAASMGQFDRGSHTKLSDVVVFAY
ncbi:unnamed protein product [Ectocarpus sp. 6 AP-2014]